MTFVRFLDADDVWLPGKLSAQVQYMTTHQEVGLLFHRWHVKEPDGAGNYVLPEIAPAKQPCRCSAGGIGLVSSSAVARLHYPNVNCDDSPRNLARRRSASSTPLASGRTMIIG